jgi:hypothetical protein
MEAMLYRSLACGPTGQLHGEPNHLFIMRPALEDNPIGPGFDVDLRQCPTQQWMSCQRIAYTPGRRLIRRGKVYFDHTIPHE